MAAYRRKHPPSLSIDHEDDPSLPPSAPLTPVTTPRFGASSSVMHANARVKTAEMLGHLVTDVTIKPDYAITGAMDIHVSGLCDAADVLDTIRRARRLPVRVTTERVGKHVVFHVNPRRMPWRRVHVLLMMAMCLVAALAGAVAARCL